MILYSFIEHLWYEHLWYIYGVLYIVNQRGAQSLKSTLIHFVQWLADSVDLGEAEVFDLSLEAVSSRKYFQALNQFESLKHSKELQEKSFF